MMHIVGTRWDQGRPCLVDHEGRTLEPSGDFHWRPGARTCIGHMAGAWRPCPDKAPVGHDAQCLACFRGRGDAQRARDMPGCIFEPRCRGVPQHCVCSFGGTLAPVPHVVYLALYGGLPKVGMTQARRLERRLREQGADAGLVVQPCGDRQEARGVEQQVATLHGLPEARSHRETFPQLVRPTDWPRIEAAAAQWMDELRGRFDVGRDLHRIHHPMPPLPGRPHLVPARREHAGTWIGGRGPYWFYTPRPRPQRLDVGRAPVLALRRADLLGCWVEARA